MVQTSCCQGDKILNEALLILPSSLPLSQKCKAAAKKVVGSSQVKEARQKREAQRTKLRERGAKNCKEGADQEQILVTFQLYCVISKLFVFCFLYMQFMN